METADTTLTSLERRMLALSMRYQGKTFREIGQYFGVTRERARQLVTRALRESSAGFRYRHKDPVLDLSEIKNLLPLLGYLKELANE